MNLFAFPFYSSLSQQSRQTECRSTYALPAPQSRWLPFVLTLPASGDGLDCVRIYHANGDLYDTVVSSRFTYEVYTDGETDYLYYYGGLVSGMNLPCDDYYLEVKGYYSEVFRAVSDLSKYLKVEWSNKTGLYESGFSNILYLDTLLSAPSYEIEEDGDDDGDNVFVALTTQVRKTYRFITNLLPEFVVDALNGMAAHTRRVVGRFNEVFELSAEVDWDDMGCEATVEVTFQNGIPTILQGCGFERPLEQVDLSNYQVGACDNTGPTWTDTGNTRCQAIDGKNTGYLEKEQENVNQLSTTVGAKRWVRGLYAPGDCPLPTQQLQSRIVIEYYTKNNCGFEMEPDGNVAVIAEAGLYKDDPLPGETVEQAQARLDKLAEDYVAQIGQQEANTKGICKPVAAKPYVQLTFELDTEGGSTGTVTAFRSDSADVAINVYYAVSYEGILTKTTGMITIGAGQNEESKPVSFRGGYPVLDVKPTDVTPRDLYTF